MIDEKKKMTAQGSSVGADDGQSISQNSKFTIPDPDEKSNSPERDLEELYRKMRRMSDPAYLHTVTLDELMDNVFEGKSAVIENLLYTGAYILAGAPKIGKSFLVAQIAHHVSTGQDLWGYKVHQGTVLYLALEDDESRLQRRMFRMFGVEGTNSLHFATNAKMIGSGLDEQLEKFIREHSDTKLIIVDTLQKVREVVNDSYSYSSDYEVIGKLKFIVLDSNINSMTEFKQIIGRGTRINEEHDKLYFTIIDFRNVTKLFADKDFDGDPVKVKETDGEIPTEETEEPPTEDIPQGEVPKEDGREIPPDVTFDPDDDTPKRVKYYVNDVPVSIINERVQYLDADGKLITESLVDYTRKNIRKEYATLDEFLQRWNSAQKKTAIVEELEQKGIFFEELREEISKDLDPFDLICHIAFDMPPLTRKERANNVKKRGYFGKYNQVAKQVLEALLDKYADEGLANLESMEILKVPDVARFGTPVEILKCFGNKKKFMEAIAELKNELYVA